MMAMPIRLSTVSAVPGAEDQAVAGPGAAPRRSTLRRAPGGAMPVCAAAVRRARWDRIAHVSRFPNRPVGLEDQDENQQDVGQDRRDLGHRDAPQIARQRVAAAGLKPEPAKRSDSDRLTGNGKGLQQADQQGGEQGPLQGAEAADDHDHEQDGSQQGRHARLRHQRRPGDDAGDAGQRRADAEHRHEDAAARCGRDGRPCADA